MHKFGFIEEKKQKRIIDGMKENQEANKKLAHLEKVKL